MTMVRMSVHPRARWTRVLLVPVFAVCFTLGAHAQAQRGALTLEEVSTLLTSGLPMASIEDGVREFGLDFRLTVTIEAELRTAGATEAFLQALRALPALITVTSDPPGATVFIDEQQRGQTPLEVRLQPGAVHVSVALDGYLNAEDTLTIDPGVAETVHMTLVAEPELRLPEPESLVPDQTASTVIQATGSRGRKLLWTGLAAVAGGGALTLVGYNLEQSRRGECQDGGALSISPACDGIKSAEYMKIVGVYTLMGGGAQTVIALLTGRSGDEDGAQNSSTVTPSGWNVRVGVASGPRVSASYAW